MPDHRRRHDHGRDDLPGDRLVRDSGPAESRTCSSLAKGQGGPRLPAPGNSSLPVISYLAVALGLIVPGSCRSSSPGSTLPGHACQMALEGPTAITKGGPSEPKQLYPAGYTGKLGRDLPDPAHRRRGHARGRGLLRDHRLHGGAKPVRPGDGHRLARRLGCSIPRPRTASMPGSIASSGCSRRNGKPPFDASSSSGTGFQSCHFYTY